MTTEKQAVLIHRVLEREACPEDLAELASLAAADATVWDQLAGALGDERTLHRGIEAARGIAATIELPLGSGAPAATEISARRSLLSWSGWVAAAVVAVAFLVVQLDGRALPRPDRITSGSHQQGVMGAEDALAQYLQAGLKEGRIVRELPFITLDVRPHSDGQGAEVIYLRRLLERATIDEVFTIGKDEHGHMVAVPSSKPPRASGKTL